MKKKYYGKRKAFLRRVMSVCIAVFVLENPLSVSADVIFEPDNGFYGRHSDECAYFNRSCICTTDKSCPCRMGRGGCTCFSYYVYKFRPSLVPHLTYF